VPAPELDPPAAHSGTVECRGVAVEYRTAAGLSVALHGVDARFEHRRLTVVAGPSGSGKSSLLRVVAGLQRPGAGSVVVDGRDIVRLRAGDRRRLRRRAMGIVLQNPADNLVEYLRAIEQVQLSARLRGSDPAQAEDLLDAVGLSDRASSYPAELSGGEQQRVAFAAAAVGDPRLLVADEPTAQLDATAGQQLVEAVCGLVDRGCTVVLASHDPAVIDAADHVLWLRDGRMVDR
jgi:putative ABC transport system ATP-binding protein/macrolide transport system ATP-binding/permease protein